MARTKKDRKAAEAAFLKELRQDAPLFPLITQQQDTMINKATVNKIDATKKTNGQMKMKSKMNNKGAVTKKENHNNKKVRETKPKAQQKGAYFKSTNKKPLSNDNLRRMYQELHHAKQELRRMEQEHRGHSKANYERLEQELRRMEQDIRHVQHQRHRMEHQRRREARQVHSGRRMVFSKNTSWNIQKPGSPCFSPIMVNRLQFSPELLNPPEESPCFSRLVPNWLLFSPELLNPSEDDLVL